MRSRCVFGKPKPLRATARGDRFARRWIGGDDTLDHQAELIRRTNTPCQYATRGRSEDTQNDNLRHHLCVIYLTETCCLRNNSVHISKVNFNSSLFTTCTKRDSGRKPASVDRSCLHAPVRQVFVRCVHHPERRNPIFPITSRRSPPRLSRRPRARSKQNRGDRHKPGHDPREMAGGSIDPRTAAEMREDRLPRRADRVRHVSLQRRQLETTPAVWCRDPIVPPARTALPATRRGRASPLTPAHHRRGCLTERTLALCPRLRL
jgi:hypothetical protein